MHLCLLLLAFIKGFTIHYDHILFIVMNAMMTRILIIIILLQTLAAITDDKIIFDAKSFCAHRMHNHLISLDILNASFNEISEVKLYRLVSHYGGNMCITPYKG